MRERDTAGYAVELHGRARARVVGRDHEESVLRRALSRAADGPVLVCVIGAAGVGKSALTTLLRLEAQSAGHRVAWISGEAIDSNSAGIEAALAERKLAFESLGRGDAPDVLVIDAFEELEEVGSWLFTEALPRAGRRLLTVLTSRRRLPTPLRTDLGVASILEELELTPLDAETSSALLRLHGVDTRHHPALHAMTGGLPLALTLVAARHLRGDVEKLFEAVPSDVVRELAIAFLRDTRSAAQRNALYALCLVRSLDQALLAALVEGPAAELFDFLHELSFVTETPEGLIPHALVREALHRDHYQRDPAAAERMAVAAAEQSVSRLRRDELNVYRHRLLDALYALREHGKLRELEMQAVAGTYLEKITFDNAPEAMKWIRHHEGEESAALLLAVLEAGAYHGFIVRNAHDGQFEGIAGVVDLTVAPPERVAEDPMLRAAKALTEGMPGHVGAFRWFFQRETYTEVGPQMAPMVFSGPAISWSSETLCRVVVFAPSPPEAWNTIAAPSRMKLVGPEFEMNGRRHQCYVRELVPPGPLVHQDAILADMALDMAMLWAGLEAPSAARAVDQDEVREALALLRRPEELRSCRLARALPEPTASVREFLERAVADLSAHAAYAEFGTVLRVTYFDESPKQRAAAVDLGLPYGTYRHHLRRAIELLTLQIRGEL